MHPFSIYTPTSVENACQAIRQWPGARFIAGGTTLVDLMKLGIERPSHLVDISGLPDLHRIEPIAKGGLRIGALATMSDVADHPLVCQEWPMIAQALNKGASAQLRNMATVGGNLMQRTRCPYFRDTASRCNKRERGSGCDAMEGVNRENALLDVSVECIALHPSDLCVALVALDTVVETIGPEGGRVIPFEALHRAPGNTPDIEHGLSVGELIAAIRIERNPAVARSTYLKVRDRESYQFAVVSVAAALDLNTDGTVRESRIGLGGVATRPWRSCEAEQYLAGKFLSERTILEAGRIAMSGAEPRRHNAFKIPLMANTLTSALTSLTQTLPLDPSIVRGPA